jgi:xylitol oxidase
MNKRTFIKASTALAGAAIASRFSACTPTSKKEPLKNWAGNLEYGTGNVHYPKTVEQVQELVKSCKKLRALGSRHSFNKIADSTENQLFHQRNE